MSRGRRTHDHEIIKNRDFDREVFCRLETELFHVNQETPWSMGVAAWRGRTTADSGRVRRVDKLFLENSAPFLQA